LVCLVVAAGCAGNGISKDDSSAVMAQLMTASFSAKAAATPAGPKIAIDQTTSCFAGGSLAISGELDGDVDATGTGTDSLDLMTTFTDCNVGNGLVINGAPYLATTGTFAFAQGALSDGTVTYSGAFSTGSYTCNVSFTFQLAAAGPPPRMSGTICGHALDVRQH
jgi:hypothetical protein